MTLPESGNQLAFERYRRQLPLFGTDGQQKLFEASVFIAGAGGLGSPLATYLAAAGVGKIVLADCDTVEKTNLNRQFLHHDADIGKSKAASGMEKLKAFNPDIDVQAIYRHLTEENIEEAVGDCRIIADALDNDETRRLLAEFALKTGRPYFHAAVSGFGGQVATFYPEEGPCFFCAFSETAEADEKKPAFPIVGATAGIIGAMQANEIIKYITGAGENQVGKLFVWNGRFNQLDTILMDADEACFCAKYKRQDPGEKK